MPGEPALGRVALAILLLRAVLRGDEFRRQWQNVLVSRCHDAGAEERMEILGRAVRTLARRAPRAMNLARAVVFGAVQRDQDPSAEALERGEHLRCLDRLDEQPIEGRGRGAIQHLADVIVAGDGGNAEQGLAVGASLSLRQDALMRQERRAAHEEQGERRQADVRHRAAVARQRPFAPVRGDRHRPCSARRCVPQGHSHLPRDPNFAARRKARVAQTVPSDQESRAGWHSQPTQTTSTLFQNATQLH